MDCSFTYKLSLQVPSCVNRQERFNLLNIFRVLNELHIETWLEMNAPLADNAEKDLTLKNKRSAKMTIILTRIP